MKNQEHDIRKYKEIQMQLESSIQDHLAKNGTLQNMIASYEK
jgi:hypothetical protein